MKGIHSHQWDVDRTYHHGKMKMVTISGMVDLIRVDKYAPLLRKK